MTQAPATSVGVAPVKTFPVSWDELHRHAKALAWRLVELAKGGGIKGEVTVLKSIAGDGDGYLIIDDLVDTGHTARVVRDLLPKAHFATVYAKPAGRPLVDSFVTEVSQDTWILFPWDIEPQFVPPIARR